MGDHTLRGRVAVMREDGAVLYALGDVPAHACGF